MPDTVDITYAGRRLRADLVTFAVSAEAARLFVAELDTDGNLVPVWKGHTYTYDDSGNLLTDTIVSGPDAWTKTYSYLPSGPASDSGWVKR